MTVVSMVKKQSEKRGWLWKRGSETEPWTKLFATIKSAQLSTFRDDKATQPTEVYALAGASVQDSVIEAAKPPGRSSRLLSLQIPSPDSEELRNLLPAYGLSLPAEGQTLQLAAPDVSEHTQWLKLLKQATSVPQLTSSIVVDEDKVLNGFKPVNGRRALRAARPLEPSVAVSAYLCSPARSPEQDILPVLNRARDSLKEGLLNLGAAREEARRCQFALNGFRRHLRDLDIGLSHRRRDSEEGGEAGLIRETRSWLQQALSLMSEIDTNLETLQMKDAPFAYEWETFAYDTLLRLQTMEEALRCGQYANIAEQMSSQENATKRFGEGSSTKSKGSKVSWHSSATRPALPYSHYKHRLAL